MSSLPTGLSTTSTPLDVLVRNGRQLSNASPDVRLNIARKMKTKHPEYIILLISGVDVCMKFLVQKNLKLGLFLEKACEILHLTQLSFEGHIFPPNTLLESIYTSLHNDDQILYASIIDHQM